MATGNSRSAKHPPQSRSPPVTALTPRPRSPNSSHGHPYARRAGCRARSPRHAGPRPRAAAHRCPDVTGIGTITPTTLAPARPPSHTPGRPRPRPARTPQPRPHDTLPHRPRTQPRTTDLAHQQRQPDDSVTRRGSLGRAIRGQSKSRASSLPRPHFLSSSAVALRVDHDTLGTGGEYVRMDDERAVGSRASSRSGSGTPSTSAGGPAVRCAAHTGGARHRLATHERTRKQRRSSRPGADNDESRSRRRTSARRRDRRRHRF